MVVDFLHYVEIKKRQDALQEAERVAETALRAHLELVLADLLSELQAA